MKTNKRTSTDVDEDDDQADVGRNTTSVIDEVKGIELSSANITLNSKSADTTEAATTNNNNKHDDNIGKTTKKARVASSFTATKGVLAALEEEEDDDDDDNDDDNDDDDDDDDDEYTGVGTAQLQGGNRELTTGAVAAVDSVSATAPMMTPQYHHNQQQQQQQLLHMNDYERQQMMLFLQSQPLGGGTVGGNYGSYVPPSTTHPLYRNHATMPALNPATDLSTVITALQTHAASLQMAAVTASVATLVANAPLVTYYAVRKGANGLSGCIFLSWESAKSHVENYDGADYKTFPNIFAAEQWLHSDHEQRNQRSNSSTKNVNVETTAGNKRKRSDGNESNKTKNRSKKSNTKDENATKTNLEDNKDNNSTSSIDFLDNDGDDDSGGNDRKELEYGGKDFGSGNNEERNEDQDMGKRCPDETSKSTPIHNKWRETYDQLVQYHEQHGITDVPLKKDNAKLSNRRLTQFVSRQRREYAKYTEGKSTSMTQEKIDLLKQIQFDFEHDTFQERFEQIRQYRAIIGDSKSIPSFSHPQLGKFTKCAIREVQRHRDGKKLNHFTSDQVESLIGLGFDEKNTSQPILPSTEAHDKKWHKMFSELKTQKEANSSVIPPKGSTLDKWISRQKRQYILSTQGKPSTLKPDKLALLLSIGVDFRPRWSCESFDEKLEQLKKYREIHGNLKVPRSHPKLGRFVQHHRHEHVRYVNGDKKTSMTEERSKLLSDLGFNFQVAKPPPPNYKPKSWLERFQELLEYKNINGDCMVPQVYSENKQLGKWVASQRKEYKKMIDGKKSYMNPNKIHKLTEVGFVWNCFKYRNNKRQEQKFRQKKEQSSDDAEEHAEVEYLEW